MKWGRWPLADFWIALLLNSPPSIKGQKKNAMSCNEVGEENTNTLLSSMAFRMFLNESSGVPVVFSTDFACLQSCSAVSWCGPIEALLMANLKQNPCRNGSGVWRHHRCWQWRAKKEGAYFSFLVLNIYFSNLDLVNTRKSGSQNVSLKWVFLCLLQLPI